MTLKRNTQSTLQEDLEVYNSEKVLVHRSLDLDCTNLLMFLLVARRVEKLDWAM